MAQTLTEIKALLAAYGLRPKYRLGQNFLHDHNQMRRILDAAAIAPGDLVLEVGSGTGALTERLLGAGARVVAVEIDTDLEPLLRDRLAPFADQLTLIFADVLTGKHQLNTRVLEALGGRDFQLIANPPYNVASPLLANLAADTPTMRRAVVMVQKEVADRLLAGPGTKAYGPLGILIQALCQVKRVGTLSPGCFWPQPKVASAVVHLARREPALTDETHRFSALLQRLFSRRRKQLKTIVGQAAVVAADLPPTARPEQLTVAQLVRLAKVAVEPDAQRS